MHDSYLIDGYNLIHALGMIRKLMGPGGLEESRNTLLAFLAKAFGENASRVTIVFDAQHAPRAEVALALVDEPAHRADVLTGAAGPFEDVVES